jgi:glycine cleavage system H protein
MSLRFTKDHEWIRAESDGTATIGISDHAQSALGDVVFVDLPAVGRSLAAKEAMAVVESVKAASDVYAPVAGTVVAVNAALAGDPGAVNRDATGAGWFVRLKPSDPTALAALMDAAAYAEFLASA